jgi:hypothetical protein
MKKGIQRWAMAFMAWAATGTIALATSTQELEKSCNQGNSTTCLLLGGMFYEGDGVRQDKVKAAQFYQKSCDVGDSRSDIGCAFLARAYYHGDGVRQDMAKAAQLYLKSCDGGATAACNILGTMYSNGEGVRQDKVRALQFYQKACERKFTDGCNNAKKLQQEVSAPSQSGGGSVPAPARQAQAAPRSANTDLP